jgi:hypothetical protein
MVKRGMRLSGIARANLREDGGADLVPRQLQDLLLNIKRDVRRIGIRNLQIKVGCLEEHWTILEARVQYRSLNLRRCKGAQVVDTKEGHKVICPARPPFVSLI